MSRNSKALKRFSAIRTKKPKKSIDVDSYPPAIVDDKLQVDSSAVLLLRRSWRPDSPVSFARVKNVTEDGYVYLDDETLGQQFAFQLGGKDGVRLIPDLRIFQASEERT